ncbi:MAG: hypothetical protein RR132_02130 [Rikenellaceae bacterium]
MFNIEPIILLNKAFKQGVPQDVINQAIEDNTWFTKDNIRFAINAISSEMLDREKLNVWIGKYSNKGLKGKRIALIMAGNIPLVGIFDLLCVIILNGIPIVKFSSKDKALMGWVVKVLQENGVEIETLNDNSKIDVVIATGSDSSNLIFKQKYGSLPLLTRGSRTSIAIIPNPLTQQEAVGLWIDVFQYFGLGCRNVSHLLIKRGVSINSIAEHWLGKTINNQHFTNSYTQKKAIMSITNAPFIDCGCFLFRESNILDASMGEITYSYYENEKEKNEFLSNHKDELQCIVAEEHIPFGAAQRPTLNDWADGIDTIKFLMSFVDRA